LRLIGTAVVIQGNLFATGTLIDGLCRRGLWQAPDCEALAVQRDWIHGLIALEGRSAAFGPADLAHAILSAIGWGHCILPLALGESEDIRHAPDALLFPEATRLAQARDAQHAWDKAREAVCVLVMQPRDEAGGTASGAARPTDRLLASLDPAAREAARPRWGMLTDGRHWSLYPRGADPDGCIGLDVAGAVNAPAEDPALRLFVLLFGRNAFVAKGEGRSLLDALLAAGR